MTKFQIVFIILSVVIVLGLIVLPIINRRSFRNLPPDQKVRILIKGAKSLAHFKNVSNGSTGVLYFVKNKRKIISFPWILQDGKMLCKRQNPFEHWDYPEEKSALTDDELSQLKAELEKYNHKNAVKIEFI